MKPDEVERDAMRAGPLTWEGFEARSLTAAAFCPLFVPTACGTAWAALSGTLGDIPVARAATRN